MQALVYNKELSEIDPEELGFITALSEVPNEMTTRLVYADWLQERDDPRHRGYRAMVSMGVIFKRTPSELTPAVWYIRSYTTKDGTLPTAWLNKVPTHTRTDDKCFSVGQMVVTNTAGTLWWNYRAFVLLETIAVAFLSLTPSTQERYLAGKTARHAR